MIRNLKRNNGARFVPANESENSVMVEEFTWKGIRLEKEEAEVSHNGLLFKLIDYRYEGVVIAYGFDNVHISSYFRLQLNYQAYSDKACFLSIKLNPAFKKEFVK